ncbi:MAG: glycosyltransferase [Sphingomicrobium sp.]
MRLLFAHDHRFDRGPAGELYSAGTFPSSVWDRFLDHFEQVQVMARGGCAIADGARLARTDRERVQFDFLPNLGSFRQLLLGSPEAKQRMFSAVKSADAVVARLPSEIGLLAVKYARRLGKPFAVELVGCVWDSYRTHGSLEARLYAPLAYARTRAAVAAAPFVLYVTDRWLQQRYPSSRYSCSASNVALETMDEAGMCSRDLRLARLPEGHRPVLGTIGTLWTKYKGLQTAIDALAQLRSSGIDLTYRILGPGPSEEWKQLARERGVGDLVFFDGTLPAGAEVAEWLDHIDVYLQPSFTEGLPRGMIEAMSRGAACVGSSRGGIPELLPRERLHEAGDAAGLEQIIGRLAGDPSAIAKASQEDRQTARRFEAHLLAKRRSDFYARVRDHAERTQRLIRPNSSKKRKSDVHVDKVTCSNDAGLIPMSATGPPMKLLFAHDHRFLKGADGEFYTSGSFPAAAWERYRGHFDSVRVIARNGGKVSDPTRFARADADGVSFEFLPSLASARQLFFPSRELDKRMEAAVAESDAVVGRLPSEIGMLAIEHARRLNKPYATEVVGCAWDGLWNNGALSARIYAPLAFLRMRQQISAAPLALYVTTAWLQGRYPTKGGWETASNVVLTPMDSPGVARRESRLAELAAGERPVLGTIASLYVQSKGIQTALDALAKLRESGMELSYRVLGPGPVERWRKLADKLGVGDLVHFDGTRSAGEEVCKWLDGIDLYLQPSFQEGLPRGLIEAMSRGAACVGSTRGGIPELLPSDRQHQAGDAASLARIIRRLAEDPAAIAEASRFDRETSRQFDAELLRKRRSDFYARLRAEAEKRRSSR